MSKMFSCKESMKVVKSELKKENLQRMAVYESKLLWGDNVTQNCSYPIYLKFGHHLIKNFYAQVFISFTGRGFFPEE